MSNNSTFDTRYEFLSSRPVIIQGLTPAMSPLSSEVLATISGAPPAAPVGHSYNDNRKNNMVASPPYLVELPDGRHIAPPPGLPMPNSMVASQVGRPGRPDIFIPGPPPDLILPSTTQEMRLLDVQARRFIRRSIYSRACDEELEALTHSWLRFLKGLHEHQESYPTIMNPRRHVIIQWRDIIERLHDIVRRSAFQEVTALNMGEIFPEHMLGADGLPPLEQARLAIIDFSQASFGDFLAAWVHQSEPSGPSFWIKDYTVRWVARPLSGIGWLLGNRDMRFLGAIDYLDECGGEEQFFVFNVRSSSDGEPRQQGSSELAGEQSDHGKEPSDWYDEEDGGYLADEEDIDEALDIEDCRHKVEELLGDEESEECEEFDGLTGPDDLRRTLRELLEDMSRDLDTMIEAVPNPEKTDRMSAHNGYRQTPQSVDDAPGPEETPELRDVDLAFAHSWRSQQSAANDMDNDNNGSMEPEWLHDQEFEHWDICSHGVAYLDGVDQDSEDYWTDDDQFYPNSNQSSAFGQAITNNKCQRCGDCKNHDNGEELGEGDQDWSTDDNDEDYGGLSDTGTGTVIHTPSKSGRDGSEDDESRDDDDDDDDPSDGSGPEGEQEEQPDGPWLPIRQPLQPAHSLYGFRARWEAFEPLASPILRSESLLPPIQRPVVSVPVQAPAPAPARPTPALPQLSQQALELISQRRFDRILANLNAKSSSSSQARRLHLPPPPPFPQQQRRRQPLVHLGQPLFVDGGQFQDANIMNADLEERLLLHRIWHGDSEGLRFRPLYRAMVAGMARR